MGRRKQDKTDRGGGGQRALLDKADVETVYRYVEAVRAARRHRAVADASHATEPEQRVNAVGAIVVATCLLCAVLRPGGAPRLRTDVPSLAGPSTASGPDLAQRAGVEHDANGCLFPAHPAFNVAHGSIVCDKRRQYRPKGVAKSMLARILGVSDAALDGWKVCDRHYKAAVAGHASRQRGKHVKSTCAMRVNGRPCGKSRDVRRAAEILEIPVPLFSQLGLSVHDHVCRRHRIELKDTYDAATGGGSTTLRDDMSSRDGAPMDIDERGTAPTINETAEEGRRRPPTATTAPPAPGRPRHHGPLQERAPPFSHEVEEEARNFGETYRLPILIDWEHGSDEMMHHFGAEDENGELVLLSITVLVTGREFCDHDGKPSPPSCCARPPPGNGRGSRATIVVHGANYVLFLTGHESISPVVEGTLSSAADVAEVLAFVTGYGLDGDVATGRPPVRRRLCKGIWAKETDDGSVDLHAAAVEYLASHEGQVNPRCYFQKDGSVGSVLRGRQCSGVIAGRRPARCEDCSRVAKFLHRRSGNSSTRYHDKLTPGQLKESLQGYRSQLHAATRKVRALRERLVHVTAGTDRIFRKVFLEAGQDPEIQRELAQRPVMRALWETQARNIHRRVRRGKTAKHGYRWNVLVINFALVIFCHSRGAYATLRRMLDLPSPRTLHSHISALKVDEGYDYHLLDQERARYEEFMARAGESAEEDTTHDGDQERARYEEFMARAGESDEEDTTHDGESDADDDLEDDDGEGPNPDDNLRRLVYPVLSFAWDHPTCIATVLKHHAFAERLCGPDDALRSLLESLVFLEAASRVRSAILKEVLSSRDAALAIAHDRSVRRAIFMTPTFHELPGNQTFVRTTLDSMAARARQAASAETVAADTADRPSSEQPAKRRRRRAEVADYFRDLRNLAPDGKYPAWVLKFVEEQIANDIGSEQALADRVDTAILDPTFLAFITDTDSNEARRLRKAIVRSAAFQAVCASAAVRQAGGALHAFVTSAGFRNVAVSDSTMIESLLRMTSFADLAFDVAAQNARHAARTTDTEARWLLLLADLTERTAEVPDEFQQPLDDTGVNGSEVPSGLLMWDEVKVEGLVVFNVQSNEVKGFCVDPNPDKCPTVASMFGPPDTTGESLDRTAKPAQFVLQFMWQDLRSSFRFAGPFFRCTHQLSGQELADLVYDVIVALATRGFYTDACVCDAAGVNWKAIRLLVASGDASVRHDNGRPSPTTDEYSMPNPCFPWGARRRIFFFFCAVHVLKNVRNQFFASRTKGKKAFWNPVGRSHGDSCAIRWDFIRDVLERDKKRAKGGQGRLVRRLSEDAVSLNRNPWLKMRVPLARAIFDGDVLAEMRAYADASGSQDELATIEFLERVHDYFFGVFFASRPKPRVYSMDSPVFRRLERSLRYFERWASALSDDERKKGFIAKQTYDQLKINAASFRGLCEQFFRLYPGSYLMPCRFTQNAVESLFGQLRQMRNSGNRLSSESYGQRLSMARALSASRVQVARTSYDPMERPIDGPSYDTITRQRSVQR